MKTRTTILAMIFSFLIFTACKDNEKKDEVIEVEQQEEIEQEAQDAFPDDNTVDAIETDPELSTFGTALNSWNVENQLEEMQAYTVFAPDNEAYTDIYQLHGQDLIGTSSDEITPFHVVSRDLTLAELKQQIKSSKDTLRVPTVQGEELKITKEGNNIILVGASGAKAKVTDSLETRKGQVYVVDTVLLPSVIEKEVTIIAEE